MLAAVPNSAAITAATPSESTRHQAGGPKGGAPLSACTANLTAMSLKARQMRLRGLHLKVHMNQQPEFAASSGNAPGSLRSAGWGVHGAWCAKPTVAAGSGQIRHSSACPWKLGLLGAPNVASLADFSAQQIPEFDFLAPEPFPLNYAPPTTFSCVVHGRQEREELAGARDPP